MNDGYLQNLLPNVALYTENNDKIMTNTNELIFGIRPVIEALKAGKEIDKLFLQNSLNGDLIQELKTLVRQRNIHFQYVPVEKLNRMTTKNHQGVICFISSITYYSIEDVLPTIFEAGRVPLLLILDRITDVRNLGAIARTVYVSGADALIIPLRGGAQINADAIKTSAGALHKVQVCREHNLKDTIDFLKASGVRVIACTEKARNTYFEEDFTIPTAIIMGSEEDGISPEYIKRSDAAMTIPMVGDLGSLNVSVAAGIVLYEAIRQRMK